MDGIAYIQGKVGYIIRNADGKYSFAHGHAVFVYGINLAGVSVF